ncbi:MSMEG_4193 family putative phosphomutase [Calidifontibacter terrae]
MTTVLLLRHGRSTSNAAGTLAGWTEGIGLDDTGRSQVVALGERLAPVPLASVVTSPLLRCRETTEAVVGHRDLEVVVDEEVGECKYGAWTGRALKDLAQEELWKVVQHHPSAATFPPGDFPHESIAQMQRRAMAALQRHDERITDNHGPNAVWALVSHGDVIKSILADCLGQHLDLFQRINVGPASLSAIRLTPERSFVLRLNDTGSDPADLVPQPEAEPHSDAAVGGGSTTAG